MLTINEIRIENQRGSSDAAVITDRAHPRFSFSMTSDRRAAALRSACIEVNGWKKEIRDQLNIQYTGPALEPFQTYSVRITAQDDAGEQAAAERLFQTGRMGLPWAGKWISDAGYHFESPSSPIPMLFRRTFTVSKPVKQFRVLATAMGIYDLALDGERINQDYFAPGFTDYRAHLQYGCYERNDLQPGEHVFTAVVAGGWAVGRTTNVSNTNQSVSKRSAERQSLLAELRLQYEDGSTEVIGTDERFQVTEDGPWRFADFYDGETYHANRVAAAAVWRPATEEKLKVSPAIFARYGEPVTAHEVLEPVAWTRAPSGELICDFGQNIAGVISVKLTGAAGQKIVFRHGEALENGELYVQNLRSAKQTITYVCRDGEQEYSPHFTYMGFRYVGICGIEKEDLTIRAVALYSDLEQIGRFHCSNEDLNQLQRNLVWSGKDNFVDIPTDCPQRDERQGWTGDIALFASTACFNFDMGRFLDKWLLDMKSEQGKTGSIPFVIPSRKGVTPSITTSCWGDSCILVPYTLYLSTGDTAILRRQYPVMKKYLADARRWAALSFPKYKSFYIFQLMFQFGDWCAPYGSVPDWLKKGPWVGTAYYANSCRIMSEIAGVLCREKDSRHYAALADKIGEAFQKVFLDENGWLKEEFQTGYVLPLYFRLADEKKRKIMAERLWTLIEANGCHLSTGFTATPYILFALADNGYGAEAYRLLLQDTSPSWLYQIRHGATTLWEQWDAMQEDGSIKEASLNHYAYGAVGDFFYRRICGLEPVEAGYRKFTVKPVPGGDLRFAECEHRCPFGTIQVRWEQQDGKFYLCITVPVNTVCHVVLPNGEEKTVGSGKYEFEQLA